MWESLNCLHKRDVFVFHYEIMQAKTIANLKCITDRVHGTVQ